VHFIDLLLPTIEHFRILGYWIVLAVAFWESTAFFGMIVPGVLLFPSVGFLAAHGFLHPVDGFWFCFVGTSGGYILSYFLGKRSEGLASGFKRFPSLSPQLESVKKIFSKYGLWAMIPGRFLAIGSFIPFFAGLSSLPFRRFLVFACASNAVGMTAYILAGYFAGHAWISLGLWSTRFFFFLVTIAAVLAIFILVRTLIVRGIWPLTVVLSSLIRSMAEGAGRDPAVRSFIDRHPRGAGFVSGRFDPSRFEGLPLTLLCLATGFSVLLLGGLIQDLLASDPIVAADQRLAMLILAFRTPVLLSVFLKVTLLGNWQIILGGAILLSVYLFVERKRDFLLPFWIALGGCGFFTTGGKWLFHRQRPFDMTSLMEFSFPSGHSAYTACFYGFLAYFLIRQAKSRSRKVDLIFLWGLIVSAVAFSRLYIGVHYLSDILAGGLLGLSWLLIGISIAEWKKARQITVEPVRSGTTPLAIKGRYRGSILLVAGVLLYIFVAATYTPPYFRDVPSPVISRVSIDPLAPFDSGRMPRFTETIIATPQEPLSFIIYVKNEESLVRSLEKAGWMKADPVSFRSLVRAFKAALLNGSYPHAPVTPSFWNGVPLNIAFEKETAMHSIRQRHHIRVWKTGYRLPDGRLQYVGTASFDKGMNWLHMTHRIDPAIDVERKTLVEDCLGAGVLSGFTEVTFVEPSAGSNFSGDIFFSDGKIAILYLASK